MIRHICMFKLKNEFDGKSKVENLNKTIELSQALRDIPSVINFEVVTNCAGTPDNNYDISLIIDVEDVESLNEYQKHPKHLEFGKFITEVREGRACIDFEI
ncbi:MAG: Dabb family protein [Lachnospiraceae bacterium]